MAEALTPLGIIAGKGQLPSDLVQHCQAQGRPFFLLAISGQTPEETVRGLPHAWVGMAEVGAALEHLHRASVRDVVLAGAVERPSLSALKPDKEGAKLIASLSLKRFLGDDSLLRGVVDYLEKQGFRIVGVDEVIGHILMPEGALSKIPMPASAAAGAMLGLRAAKALGALDIGQGVVVQGGRIIAVEAAEGTDAMLTRAAALLKGKEPALFIKTAKPQQETRVDLPTIGPETVIRCHGAGITGIVAEAGRVLIVSREQLVREANQRGVWVAGLHAPEQ